MSKKRKTKIDPVEAAKADRKAGRGKRKAKSAPVLDRPENENARKYIKAHLDLNKHAVDEGRYEDVASIKGICELVREKYLTGIKGDDAIRRWIKKNHRELFDLTVGHG